MSPRAWWISGAVSWNFTLFVILSGYGPWWILLTPTIFILRLPGLLAARARAEQEAAIESHGYDISHRLIGIPPWVGHAHSPLEFTCNSTLSYPTSPNDLWDEEIYVTFDGWAFRLRDGDLEAKPESELHSDNGWEPVLSTERTGLTDDTVDLVKTHLAALQRPRVN